MAVKTKVRVIITTKDEKGNVVVVYDSDKASSSQAGGQK